MTLGSFSPAKRLPAIGDTMRVFVDGRGEFPCTLEAVEPDGAILVKDIRGTLYRARRRTVLSVVR